MIGEEMTGPLSCLFFHRLRINLTNKQTMPTLPWRGSPYTVASLDKYDRDILKLALSHTILSSQSSHVFKRHGPVSAAIFKPAY